jgi:phosphoglycerate dehydrogenase-like enzyme
VSKLIVVPSYVRDALPADLPNVVELDEKGDLPDEVLAQVSFYVRAYYAGWREGELIARMPNVQVVQTLTAGVDDVLPFMPSGVTLCNAAGVHDASTAELTVGLMIAMQRGIHEYRDRQHQGLWQHEFRPALADSRVLIIGAGNIAKAIARRLEPFEVTVDRIGRTERTDELGRVHAMSALDDLLPQADIVSLIVPHTPETEGLVDAAFLSRMKDGALLVNTARGKVVDTQALLDALHSGRIRAALDVTDPEPLPHGHPLWDAPNCLITPHIGGDTSAFLPRAKRLVSDQVGRWLRDEQLRNIVSP